MNSPPDHRRAAAERSVASILDAAQQLLLTGQDASTSAVAAAAGVSRVTLYSHFPTRAELLDAVANRVVGASADAIQAAALSEGSPAAALERLIETAWTNIGDQLSLLATAQRELSSEALLAAHRQIDEPVLNLIERGRSNGVFRTDVPSRWLLASYYALMHAAGNEVNAGRLDPDHALPTIKATIRSVFNAN